MTLDERCPKDECFPRTGEVGILERDRWLNDFNEQVRSKLGK